MPVVVSAGPPPVAVPDLAGLTQTDATNRLIGAGLKLGNVTGRYDSTDQGCRAVVVGPGRPAAQGQPGGPGRLHGPPVVAVPSIGSGSFAAADGPGGGST